MSDNHERNTEERYRSGCAEAISQSLRDDAGNAPDPFTAIKLRGMIEEEMRAGNLGLVGLIKAGRAVLNGEALGAG